MIPFQVRGQAICFAMTISAVLTLAVGTASANERHFTYTYETATLPEGEKEVEIWNTLKAGRDNYYARLEHRLEFEWGVTDNLTTALYYNTKGAYTRGGGKTYYYPSMSWEWKYKLTDAYADPIGSALYLELGGNAHEYEVEAKLLLDKRIGNILVATNLVFEQEWKYPGMADKETEEVILEADLGVAYFLTPTLTVGLESHIHGSKEGDEDLEVMAIYAGPVVSWSTRGAWLALTIMPQISALYFGDNQGTGLDLDGHERVNARLLAGFHF
jgi:hypothetical protein